MDRLMILEGMRIRDYSIAIPELRNVLDLMTKARDYMRNVSSKNSSG